MGPGTITSAPVTEWSVITDLVVILVSAAAVAVVMQPMRLATIPTYLIAGEVVGPRSLGLVDAARSHGLHRCRYRGRAAEDITGIRPARRFGGLR